MCFYLNGGSNHPSSVYKVKLPYDAVVCTRDVTRAHLRAPFTLPEAARERGGICQHLPSGTEIDATAGAATAATATGYTTDAAATAAAIAVNADAAAAATIVPRYSSAGQPPIRSGGQRRAATRRTRAQSRPHRRGLLSMLTNEHNIGQVFVEKRPPSQSLAKAPTCPAS